MILRLHIYIVFFICVIACPVELRSQVQMPYVYNHSQGVYQELEDGIPIWQDTVFADLAYIQVTPFGWDGVMIDSIAVSSNGWIRLGEYHGTRLEKDPFVADSSRHNGQPLFTVNGYGHLLINSDVEPMQVSYLEENGMITIEYKNMRRFGTTNERLNFQIRLNTTDESVDLVYGDFELGTFPPNLNRESRFFATWSFNRGIVGLSSNGQYLKLKTYFGRHWSEASFDPRGHYGCFASNDFPASVPPSGFSFHFETINQAIGCTNPLAMNYEPTAEVSGLCRGSSETSGCLDTLACNYDSTAQFEGTCEYGCYGCADPSALQYIDDPEIVLDNCVYDFTGLSPSTGVEINLEDGQPWCHLWTNYLGGGAIDANVIQFQTCVWYRIQTNEAMNVRFSSPARYGGGIVHFALYDQPYGWFVAFDGYDGELPVIDYLLQPDTTYYLSVSSWGYDVVSFLLEVKELPLCQRDLPQLPAVVCNSAVGSIESSLSSVYDLHWIVNETDTIQGNYLSYQNLSQGINHIRLLSDFEACPLDTLYEILVPEPSTIVIPNDTAVCRGEVITLAAISDWPVTWNWNLPNNSEVTVNGTGSYIARFIDSLGCPGSQTLHVTQLITPNPTIFQNNQTLQLVDSNLSTQWLLDGVPIEGATASTYQPQADGNYSVAQSYGSCADTSQIYYFDYIHPSCVDFLPPELPNSLCPELDWSWMLDVGLNDSFFWIINGSDTTINSQLTPELFAEGENELVLYTELSDCPISFSTAITKYTDSEYVEILSDSSICEGDFLLLLGQSSSPIDWMGDLTEGASLQLFQDTSIIASVTDPCGFTFYDELHVDVIPKPGVEILSDPFVCEGDEDYLLSAQAEGTILWGEYSNNMSIHLEQDTVLYVEVINEQGCSRMDSVAVDLVALPTIDIQSESLHCLGNEEYLLSATSDGNITWGVYPNNTTIHLQHDTLLYVESTSAQGCLSLDSISVDIIELPAIEILSDTFVCAGLSDFLLAANSDGDIFWGAYPNATTISITQDTLLFVTATNLAGCTFTDSLWVSVMELPNQDLGTTNDMITAAEASTYQWYFNETPIAGATGDTLVPFADGMYYVVLTNAVGCEVMSETINYYSVGETSFGAVSVFPNPTIHSSVVTWRGGSADVLILNNIGQTIEKWDHQQSPLTLSTLNWSQGCYFVVLTKNGVTTKKALIKE